MNAKIVPLFLAFGAATCLLNAQEVGPQAAAPQPPPASQPPPGSQPQGGRNRSAIRILPPRAAQWLNLTSDQQKQVDALEADVQAKMAKILTPEQLQQLQQMRRGRGRGRFGGGPGGPRGPGGPGGPDNGDGHPPPPPAGQ